MLQFTCENCGSHEYIEKDGFRTCQYCKSKFSLTAADISTKECSITLIDDIEMLLKKCRDNPQHAQRFANLILDIDPSNKEALKYLRR